MWKMEYKYKRGQPAFALDRGVYDGYEYLVISLGRHPCGYVILTEDNKYFGKFYDDIPINCHGGLTFSDSKISFLEWSEKYKCMVRTRIRFKIEYFSIFIKQNTIYSFFIIIEGRAI